MKHSKHPVSARIEDAILFVDSNTFTSGSFGGGTGAAIPTRGGAMAFGSGYSASTRGVQYTVLLIKWKDSKP